MEHALLGISDVKRVEINRQSKEVSFVFRLKEKDNRLHWA